MTAGNRRPRIVLITRRTPLEQLLDRHGTHGQAEFYLRSRGQSIKDYETAHERLVAGFGQVVAALPADQRRVRVDRGSLDRFLFAPDDVAMVVGQDGLVPNVAKYLSGQLLVGVNPDPQRYDGVLCRHTPASVPWILQWLAAGAGRFRVEERVMALAEREDGQRLLSLNEIFVGHRTHQSARYVLRCAGREERHSSSGVICSTGTGATGWGRSIAEQRGLAAGLPAPIDPRLVWFVREPFPSVASGTDLNFGLLERGDTLELTSLLGEDGVIFADGIESDRIDFLDGQTVRIGLAPSALRLLVPRSG